ncbi:hypothetical protein BV25DRAFT_1042032 [Artomyces pyxidatus]|uniref:Uncharacterized protein n=1 Tax=Artomyces pyxidatus TaxID=48021 RepID=A0ACB8STI0_9AGAM|nr:hypothetical protein BV25DRAFT_1042032 [Artomyces pyxidatus]
MLRLFDDVLLEILQHLDFQSLISCQATCRKLRRIFIGSTSLQYTAELAACGALDGPHESEHNTGQCRSQMKHWSFSTEML